MFQTKRDIYEEFTALLTHYEHPEDYEGYDDVDWEVELYEMLVKIQNRWDDTITADEYNNTSKKGETTMSLIDELRAKSNSVEMTKQEVIEEIKAYFEEYLYSDNLENQLKRRIGERQIAERKVCLIVDFWAYSSGCSSTYFHCGGKTWNNPENPEYYASQEYKGIKLFDIQKEICVALRDKLVKRMKELGFRLIEDKDETGWLKYYNHLLYFGW